MHKYLIGAAIAAMTVVTPALAQKATGVAAPKPAQTTLRTQVSTEVASQFARLDTNKDGSISKAEMDAVMAKRQAAKFDPSKMFARVDGNKDGKVTPAEMQAAWATRASAKGKSAGKAPDFKPLFARADTNKDGAISLAEYSAVPHPGGKPNGGGMMNRADLNKDGKVTLAEAQQLALQQFDRVDANKDGKLTPQERQQVLQKMRAARKPS